MESSATLSTAERESTMQIFGEIIAKDWVEEAHLQAMLPCLLIKNLVAQFVVSYCGLKVMGMALNPKDDTS